MIMFGSQVVTDWQILTLNRSSRSTQLVGEKISLLKFSKFNFIVQMKMTFLIFPKKIQKYFLGKINIF
jgi:hypothetical protein